MMIASSFSRGGMEVPNRTKAPPRWTRSHSSGLRRSTLKGPRRPAPRGPVWIASATRFWSAVMVSGVSVVNLGSLIRSSLEFLGSDGFVRLEEAPRVLHDLVDVRRRILPGIDGHLGLRGEAGHLHRDLVRVRGHVVRRYEQRRLDGAHEIARHGENEVGAVGVHAGEEGMDHVHRDVGALRAKRWPTALDVVLAEKVRDLRPETGGLHHRRRDAELR